MVGIQCQLPSGGHVGRHITKDQRFNVDREFFREYRQYDPNLVIGMTICKTCKRELQRKKKSTVAPVEDSESAAPVANPRGGSRGEVFYCSNGFKLSIYT